MQTAQPVVAVTLNPFVSGFSTDVPLTAQSGYRGIWSPCLLDETVTLIEFCFLVPGHKRPRSVTQGVSLKCHPSSESVPSVEPTSKKSHGSAERRPSNQLIAEIKGVDIYDPTTGQIRNSSTDDIACWLIDTEYNGESFFVRHAYFTGADEPYEKLKRALRADIDEAAWSTLYSTVSRPFDKPKTGKIAIKVINHYGDEVLKVFEC